MAETSDGTPLRPADRAAMCDGKARFDRPTLARKAAKRRPGIFREAYRCRACGGWHVGSPLERPR